MNRKARRVLRALARAPRGPVVEIGCLRHGVEIATDGFSTYYLARACAARGMAFHSFDLDPQAVATANRVLRDAGLPEAVRCLDARAALPDIGPVALLYLDSSDDPRDTLAQYAAAALLPRARVLVDDAQAYGGNTLGKATALAERFRREGQRFRVVPTEPGYHMLVVRVARGKAAEPLDRAPLAMAEATAR